MRLHALQVASVWENHIESRDRIESLCSAAGLGEGDFVITSELCETGFSTNPNLAYRNDSLPWAAQLAKRHRVWLQFGCAIRRDGRATNAAVIIDPSGTAVATYFKCMLFTPGEEHRAYEAGADCVVVDIGSVKVAPMICYDLRFPELWRRAALRGAELFTMGACWPDRRAHHWGPLIAARAIECQAWVVAANSCGIEPSGSCAGRTQIVSHDGLVVHTVLAGEGVATARVDLDALREWRRSFPALADARRAHLGLPS